MPPTAASTGVATRRRSRSSPMSNSRRISRPDHEEEERHQPVVDPVAQVEDELAVAERDGELGVPEPLVGRPTTASWPTPGRRRVAPSRTIALAFSVATNSRMGAASRLLRVAGATGDMATWSVYVIGAWSGAARPGGTEAQGCTNRRAEPRAVPFSPATTSSGPSASEISAASCSVMSAMPASSLGPRRWGGWERWLGGHCPLPGPPPRHRRPRTPVPRGNECEAPLAAVEFLPIMSR